MGNILRLAYGGVDPRIMWNLIRKDLQPLAEACQAALKHLEGA
jgi:uncharacterized protein with HEPN domain